MSFLNRIKDFFAGHDESKLEYENRKNLELTAKLVALREQYEEVILATKKFFDSREKKEHRNWKLVGSNGEHWIRSEMISYVGQVSGPSFTIIIDGCEKTLTFASENEAQKMKESILNIGYIPVEENYNDIKKFKNEDEREKLGRVFDKKKSKTEKKEESLSPVDLDKLNSEIKNKKK